MVLDNPNVPYHDWSAAVTDLDLYRTVERANNYTNMLAHVDVPDAKITVRTEGGNWMVAGIDPATPNQRYRHAYYSQRRAGMVAEIMQASGTISGHSDYTTLPYYPSEVYELSTKAVEQGVTPIMLAQFNRMRDIAINRFYGESQYQTEYNLESDGKGAYISTCVSLFTWFKAAYEGGGVPGLLWQDYLCDGMATSTQYKEIKFFTQKINEMLATEKGQKWATDFTPPDAVPVEGKWSYPEEYIRDCLQNTPRICIFE